MAMKNRPRKTSPEQEKAIDRFASDAEQPSSEPQPAPATKRRGSGALPAWRQRAKTGPKNRAYNFRYNEQQQAILAQAAEEQDVPIQRVIEELVWPTLEERYGHP